MKQVDVLIIGAGIHGAGVAQAAAAAGYSVCVLEKNAIAAGTSSRSSKLIHGGLRYLESYQFSLVRKSLRERRLLTRLAPSLVRLVPFYIPVYKSTTRRPWQIRLGLGLYALLGGLHRENRFKKMSRHRLAEKDGLKSDKLQKIYRYYDGQTDDVRLTQAVMKSAQQLGAELILPAEVTAIHKNKDDFEVIYQSAQQESIRAKMVINASGPWVNELHQRIAAKEKISSLAIDLVQGTHIILDVAPPSGIYYLEAEDKRAVFVIPYQYKDRLCTMVGTTEKLFTGNADNVTASEEEIKYLCRLYQDYFPGQDATLIDHFAGLRVLPQQQGSMFSRPRDTVLHWAVSGVLTLYGGKLTAYRSTASQVIKEIVPVLGKRQQIARTDQLYLE